MQKEAIHCHFKCDHKHCTAEGIATKYQILIKLKDSDIRQEDLKKSWDLKQLQHEGMQMESAARSSLEIAGENEILITKTCQRKISSKVY